MNILDFFDVTNLDHLKAWRHLQNTGLWPVGFIPDGTEFPTLWTYHINGILADAYIDSKLNRKVL